MPSINQSFKAHEIADLLGLQLCGDGDVTVTHVEPLNKAHDSSISFLRGASTHPYHIGCVIASQPVDWAQATLISKNPRSDFSRLLRSVQPPQKATARIHATAVIDPKATIADDVSIGPYSVVGPGVEIGAGVVIGPHCVIEEDVCIGSGSQLGSHVVLARSVIIGQRCRISPQVVIGDDGFTYDKTDEGWQMAPQIGGVVIGDDVDIGPGTVIDRGFLEDTVVSDRCKIDASCMIAHGVKIDSDVLMAACTAIAGSTQIGSGCVFGGRSSIINNLIITDNVAIGAVSTVDADINESGCYIARTPLMKKRDWVRKELVIKKLIKGVEHD